MPSRDMKLYRGLIIPLVFAAVPALAEPGWTFQVSVGAVENLETSLEIRQEGSPDLELGADYESRPFEGPLYYSLRAGRWGERTGWELELIHQKIFLANRPPEVQRFDVSHGYNLVFVNRAWQARGWIWRAGAGVVAAHPENEVRGQVLDSEDTNLPGGYHLTGPALQVGIERRFEVGERWLLGLEGKASATRAVFPVAGGEAEAPNAALHLLVGFGYRQGRL